MVNEMARGGVPYEFLPFQTPLHPCAIERQKGGRREDGEMSEDGAEREV